jgi:hypothetical protein
MNACDCCYCLQDIRRDLVRVIHEVMRAARPEEQGGVTFRSLCSGEPSSMVSREPPGSEHVKVLVEGLKQLDAAFREKVAIMEQLTRGQESAAQSVAELQDSLQKVKYLVLHSIQLPAKPAADVPK